MHSTPPTPSNRNGTSQGDPLRRAEESPGLGVAWRLVRAGVRSTFGPVSLAYDPELKVTFRADKLMRLRRVSVSAACHARTRFSLQIARIRPAHRVFAPHARDNPRWGYMRIRGELLKLGINVSATTIATVLRVWRLGPAPRRIAPSWSEFLRAQAQSMLDAGLSWERGGGLEGNLTASSAPIPERAAGGVKAEELSSKGAEEPPSSWPVPGLPRLSAVAAAPSRCDSMAAPLRSSQQWHARDGPGTRRRSLHAPRFGRAPRPSVARGRRAS
jgi:hypothetical protein